MNDDMLAIVGIGIYPFGRSELTAQQMALVAIRQALSNAGVSWRDIELAVGGSLDGGQADVMVGELGPTGLPFVNVLNGCATGAASLITAGSMISSGIGELGLVVGFDKHPRGAFSAPDVTTWGVGSWYGESGMFVNPQFFGMKIQRYMHEHQITEETLAKVAAKAFANGSLNPNAWRRKAISEEEILSSRLINYPLRQFMVCSPSEGAVALVVCHPHVADKYTDTPIFVRAATLRSRQYGSFELFQTSLPHDLPPTPSQLASRAAFESSGLTPADIHLWQLQDTESGAEVMHMAEVGLCEHGAQNDLVATGATAVMGAQPVNTDGGLLANGEPVGASGLRMVYEASLQLRGDAGERQVADTATNALTHVYGAPGISACTILSTESARR
ncbi:3-ketoacyl-CoA thiolase (acaB-12) [Rhodococcus wratislaviensis]|uniref:3-ketoacyl-CoA thiolase (AcaB-12) n=1 Tax=Rhodococcus wratislaviensis TaxID=44752 RepID=A0A402CG84_RHOWR|nr:thiolase family protein [Rhodococcus wratislaviensis]GCE42567.1 3-ketoacyl-CoA thiolase (acaB-12) [Rhodococcus wratislaviensis]